MSGMPKYSENIFITKWKHPDAEAGFSTPHFYEHVCPICDKQITIYEIRVQFFEYELMHTYTYFQSRCVNCNFSASRSTNYLEKGDEDPWKCIKEANQEYLKLIKDLSFGKDYKALMKNHILIEIDQELESVNDKIKHVRDNQHKTASGRINALDQQLRQIQRHFHEALETCDKTIVNMVHNETDKHINDLLIEAKKSGKLNLSNLTKKLENKDTK